MNAAELEVPADGTVAAARVAVEALRGAQGAINHMRTVAGEGEVTVALPDAAVRALVRVLCHRADGDAVTVLPVHAELTTQETADFSSVSRPHVVKFLETGALPFRKVGTHRRVLLSAGGMSSPHFVGRGRTRRPGAATG
jgi:excisionase family DNA binding protein